MLETARDWLAQLRAGADPQRFAYQETRDPDDGDSTCCAAAEARAQLLLALQYDHDPGDAALAEAAATTANATANATALGHRAFARADALLTAGFGHCHDNLRRLAACADALGEADAYQRLAAARDEEGGHIEAQMSRLRAET